MHPFDWLSTESQGQSVVQLGALALLSLMATNRCRRCLRAAMLTDDRV